MKQENFIIFKSYFIWQNKKIIIHTSNETSSQQINGFDLSHWIENSEKPVVAPYELAPFYGLWCQKEI